MSPIDLIDWIIEAVVPPTYPPENATEAQLDRFHRSQRSYRRRVTLVACSGFLISVSFASWALGAIPGTKGFALAAQVERYETMQLDKYLTDYRIDQCASSGLLKRFYGEKIRWLRDEWVTLHGKEYDTPTCLDLGISEVPP